ncbi:hypothetical protein NL676_018353 [Syzygium grande]|nr:hypothetical protein NL676_018353 [Syzygium grande]
MVNHFAAGDCPIAAIDAVKDSLEAVGAFLGSYESPEMRKLCFWFPEGDVTVLATKGVDKELHLNFFHSKRRTNVVTKRKWIAGVAMDFASSLLTNCQLLQSLKIEKCEGLKRIGIEKNESLSSLVIVDCMDIENVTVSATELSDFDCEEVLCLLSSSKEVETLTISGWLLEWLCSAGVIFEGWNSSFTS